MTTKHPLYGVEKKINPIIECNSIDALEGKPSHLLGPHLLYSLSFTSPRDEEGHIHRIPGIKHRKDLSRQCCGNPCQYRVSAGDILSAHVPTKSDIGVPLPRRLPPQTPGQIRIIAGEEEVLLSRPGCPLPSRTRVTSAAGRFLVWVSPSFFVGHRCCDFVRSSKICSHQSED
ncbi:hypothetical protein RRG08_013075 [Elysia crispata]|uniref:Uncharacterized protein n=1 Tax=Elysia crispata TaxID=231223 RepID=A0AAE1A0R2_9GAST|nr:hypothetical protein RRG08_013075 [Elysia crispata]